MSNVDVRDKNAAEPIKMGNIADMCSFGVDESVSILLRAESVKPRELDRFASNWSN
ncbi:hypothetical protein [Nocardia farcinica]|uniref:hypothetical protein n=1 Tax=Nocardia farcinica TaxID=37329 RepID=UPI0018930EF1|nr:hypothetical protein [Nocardia farcinica]MBF6070641.1 hypothetical protein [Nocardia farcinica]MBF6233529.1 hypothetical protein [Nocardia farcinica]MBF6257778.1 hypothetical protein [Nocardia farcinica]MBF6269955.1 hypothetical protein [Nocardia farcinica]MBF6444016.1 hypothetical protein [Nocardia farcinica]